MYLKKTAGPRIVTLPDGTILTRADLPPVNTARWVASRKAKVVRGVAAGLISRDEACEMYALSEEELDSWMSAIALHGEKALKTTALKKYRQL
ncbi:MAG: CtrA inhibitor SciP [Shimia sp.]